MVNSIEEKVYKYDDIQLINVVNLINIYDINNLGLMLWKIINQMKKKIKKK
jgi:hypothetical protein